MYAKYIYTIARGWIAKQIENRIILGSAKKAGETKPGYAKITSRIATLLFAMLSSVFAPYVCWVVQTMSNKWILDHAPELEH